MAKTELYTMSKNERIEKIKAMETELLFEELDDTIQFDMLGMSNEKWLLCAEKKVYKDIVKELRTRTNDKNTN